MVLGMTKIKVVFLIQIRKLIGVDWSRTTCFLKSFKDSIDKMSWIGEGHKDTRSPKQT